MKVKEESKKTGLKCNIQKTKIMSSSPITSWQSDGEKVETVSNFICFGSKIAADCDTVMKKRKRKENLLLGRKAIKKKSRQCIKSRGITLLTKVFIVKAMVFPVVMCGCESWTIEKAEN